DWVTTPSHLLTFRLNAGACDKQVCSWAEHSIFERDNSDRPRWDGRSNRQQLEWQVLSAETTHRDGQHGYKTPGGKRKLHSPSEKRRNIMSPCLAGSGPTSSRIRSIRAVLW